MKIWANTIVNNEENFVWFAIMSVVNYVDKVLVYDTGSTDHTVKIIREIKKIKKDKIIFKEVGPVDKDKFTKMRQSMLNQSNCDWILILDGDEIWWNNSIKRVVREIDQRGDQIDGIVVPMVVSVGDIFHFQEKQAGQYKLLGRQGHYSLRAINRKILGLHVDWPYGGESYLDKDNNLIQEREKVIFLDAPYLHVTHLKRSSLKRKFNKFKYELGKLVTRSFKFPEVLYRSHPKIVPSPWVKLTGAALMKAKLLTPFRKIKRRLR